MGLWLHEIEKAHTILNMYILYVSIHEILIYTKFSPKQSKHECNVDRTLQLWRLQSHNIIPMLSGCCWPIGWSPCDKVQSVLKCYVLMCFQRESCTPLSRSRQWDFGFFHKNAKCNNSKKVLTKKSGLCEVVLTAVHGWTVSKKNTKITYMRLHKALEREEKQKCLTEKVFFNHFLKSHYDLFNNMAYISNYKIL